MSNQVPSDAIREVVKPLYLDSKHPDCHLESGANWQMYWHDFGGSGMTIVASHVVEDHPWFTICSLSDEEAKDEIDRLTSEGGWADVTD